MLTASELAVWLVIPLRVILQHNAETQAGKK
jgi:hypothetical protein